MRKKLPRGAKKLCRLVASPLADVDQSAYRKAIDQIVIDKTLHIDVRLAAAQMAFNRR